MKTCPTAVVFALVCAAKSALGDGPATDSLRDLHGAEAAAYRIYRDADHREILELESERCSPGRT